MTTPNRTTSAQVEVVNVTRGQIAYTEGRQNRVFYFQANPTSFTRSRNISIVKTDAREPAATKTATGSAGRKYSLKADDWKIEGIEINLDAGQAYPSGSASLDDAGNYDAVVEALLHLEALVGLDPLKSETNHTMGYPPLPSPPLATLRLGSRAWEGYVTSVRIEEKQFTPQLVPTRIKATLSFTAIETVQRFDLSKKGGTL